MLHGDVGERTAKNLTVFYGNSVCLHVSNFLIFLD